MHPASEHLGSFLSLHVAPFALPAFTLSEGPARTSRSQVLGQAQPHLLGRTEVEVLLEHWYYEALKHAAIGPKLESLQEGLGIYAGYAIPAAGHRNRPSLQHALARIG